VIQCKGFKGAAILLQCLNDDTEVDTQQLCLGLTAVALTGFSTQVAELTVREMVQSLAGRDEQRQYIGMEVSPWNFNCWTFDVSLGNKVATQVQDDRCNGSPSPQTESFSTAGNFIKSAI
jgi:hypothetical protein